MFFVLKFQENRAEVFIPNPISVANLEHIFALKQLLINNTMGNPLQMHT